MPPPKSHKTLSPAEVEILRRWIVQGAPYEKHWAFEPPVKSAPPTVKAASRVTNPIDAFVLARLEKEGLTLSPEADRATLIRRATLAITGLPPTLAEVDAFNADAAPDAFGKVVDRLLGSPRFGEHMAHWWLDLARYGDTHGLHLDNEREMWLYRDWVIAAFNRNLPFDQFTVEQLAGDQIPNATNDQKIASGFNRCNVTTSEGGAIDAEFRFRYAIDRSTTTAQTWLALTTQCAVCHDHKFDPISQKEVYQIYAFFNSSADPAMDGNKALVEPVVQNSTPEQRQQIAALDTKLSAQKKELGAAVKIAVQAYQDPADAADKTAAQPVSEVWMEDGFPAGATPQTNVGDAPLMFVGSPDMPPASGKLALKRTAKGVAQDFFSGGASFIVPNDAIISVMARTDPANQPRAIMIQFHTTDWKARAVWGEDTAIPYGKLGTPEHFLAGGLPPNGQWTQLDVPAEKIGLRPGDKIDGFAFTQADGTVFWDRLVVRGTNQPATDPHTVVCSVAENGGGERHAERSATAECAAKKARRGSQAGGGRKAARTFRSKRLCHHAGRLFCRGKGSQRARARTREFRESDSEQLRDARHGSAARVVRDGARALRQTRREGDARNARDFARRWTPRIRADSTWRVGSWTRKIHSRRVSRRIGSGSTSSA